MRTVLIFFCLVFFSKLQAQINLNMATIHPYKGAEIKNESEWTTGIFTTANVLVTYINIRQFKNVEKKSNAGFLLFPGLLQLGIGSIYKKQNDPTRHIDVAVGASSALICMARMIYRPKNKVLKTAMLMPYCIPSKAGWLSGFSVITEF